MTKRELTTVTLTNGEEITYDGWIAGDYYASFVVDAIASDVDAWNPFSVSKGQAIVGAMRPAGRADTNVPRTADNGLPHDWEFLAVSWWARSSLPVDDNVRRFAASCSCQFEYNFKREAQARLDRLLDGHVAFARPDGNTVAREDSTDDTVPVHVRENLPYGVVVKPESASELARFKAYLRRNETPLGTRLNTLQRHVASVNNDRFAVEELTAIVREFYTPPEALFTIHLGGFMRRPVI